MPTVLNVNEAKTNFSNVLATVENDLVTVTIMRYGLARQSGDCFV